MAKEVMAADDRRAQILETGARLGAKHGLANVTRRMVAAKLGVTDPLVSHYVGNGDVAIKAYRKEMKSLGLSEPEKDKIEAIGQKLRKERVSAQKVGLVKKATPQPASGKKVVKPKSKKPAAPAKKKPLAPLRPVLLTPPEVKSKAARLPKAPPEQVAENA